MEMEIKKATFENENEAKSPFLLQCYGLHWVPDEDEVNPEDIVNSGAKARSGSGQIQFTSVPTSRQV